MSAIAARKPPATQTRFASTEITSYDAKAHSVEAVLSVGAPVKREYGIEVLTITPSAIDLSRAKSGLVPIIDSHQIAGINNVLGRVTNVWFEKGKLVGMLTFDSSDAGRNAEGLVSRGTIRGVSIGYRVDEWEITDSDGKVIDPDRERLAWDAEYTFAATRWELLECSLVSVPADSSAMTRSVSTRIMDPRVRAILARMHARQLIATRATY
jgi:phage head maturation protease